MRSPKRVVIVAFPDVQVLDVTGPAEVFAMASRDEPRYSVEVVAPRAGRVRTSGGLQLVADGAIAECRGRIDTLVVAGGQGVRAAARDQRLVAWVADAAGRSRRVTSVCTGAFVLAEAGLLDGRRATTHWSATDRLAARYPAVDVDPEPIFVRDGRVATSAGVTAGMDLALALVDEDHGPALALEIARRLVLFVRRPGGQAQFSVQLAAAAERRPVRAAQQLIAEHLADDLTVESMARQVGMSPRNFARRFREELGVTPARYVERARVEAARHLLETTAHDVPTVAVAAGFGSPETMHRAFQRALRVTPGQYRRHFTKEAS